MILSAYIPETPVAPTTLISTNTVVITWIAPDEHGSPITEYTIKIRDSTGVYLSELTDCDGTDTLIVASTQCIVPLTTLYATPFELIKGDSIDVKVSAHNVYGESDLSPVGSGANVVTIPEEV